MESDNERLAWRWGGGPVHHRFRERMHHLGSPSRWDGVDVRHSALNDKKEGQGTQPGDVTQDTVSASSSQVGVAFLPYGYVLRRTSGYRTTPADSTAYRFILKLLSPRWSGIIYMRRSRLKDSEAFRFVMLRSRASWLVYSFCICSFVHSFIHSFTP